LLLKPCNGKRSTCPISAENLQAIQLDCEDWVDYQMWASDSWEDYLEYSLKGLGETCEPGSPFLQCDYNDDLVCYCNGSCTCVEGKDPGEECTSYGIPCIDKYVCNLKECTLHYSLTFGDQIDTEEACSGGNMKLNYDGVGLCIVGYETFGELPRKCTSNLDCISYNGLEYVDCVCGLNEEGDSYCDLHFEDEPMLNLREAEEDRDFEDQVYYRFLTENYPILQGTLPECLPNVWKDFGAYNDEDWARTLQSSLVMILLGQLAF